MEVLSVASLQSEFSVNRLCLPSFELWHYITKSLFFLFVRWDFGYCGHYWPIVPAPDDR
jgi:hypothetical protein